VVYYVIAMIPFLKKLTQSPFLCCWQSQFKAWTCGETPMMRVFCHKIIRMYLVLQIFL